MEKRSCTQTMIEEQKAKVKRWRDNPTWTGAQAAKELGTPKSTLLGWKAKFWNCDDSSKPTMRSESRFRVPGGGRKHKLTSYELQVMEYYQNCDGKLTRREVEAYCEQFDEFKEKSYANKRMWANRFLKRCRTLRVCDFTDPTDAQTDVEAEADSTDPTVVEPDGEAVQLTVVEHNEEVMQPPILVATARSVGLSAKDQCESFVEDVSLAEPDRTDTTESSEGGAMRADSEGKGQERAKSAETPSDETHDLAQDPASVISDDRGVNSVVTARHFRTRPVLRKRPNVNLPVLTFSVGQEDSQSARIPLFQADVKCLLPYEMLTCSVVDYFIFKHMATSNPATCHLDTTFFPEVASEFGGGTTDSAGERSVRDSSWVDSRFVFFPVFANHHWSFAVVENVTTCDSDSTTILFHVDSSQGAHDHAYIFAVLKWILGQERSRRHLSALQSRTHAYVTKPRQANNVDGGVYMLHYMSKVTLFVNEKNPLSLEYAMPRLTRDGFNVALPDLVPTSTELFKKRLLLLR